MPLDYIFVIVIQRFGDRFDGFARVHAFLEGENVEVPVFWNSIFQVDFGNRFFATIKRKHKDGKVLRAYFHIDVASTHQVEAFFTHSCNNESFSESTWRGLRRMNRMK